MITSSSQSNVHVCCCPGMRLTTIQGHNQTRTSSIGTQQMGGQPTTRQLGTLILASCTAVLLCVDAWPTPAHHASSPSPKHNCHSSLVLPAQGPPLVHAMAASPPTS
eukprot:5934252-Karenia_brevis.AAC.1